MNTVCVSGYQIDRRLLSKVFYSNDCDQVCRGKCCQGAVYLSGEEMDRIYAHLEDLRPIMRPLRSGPERWFVFDEEVLDNSRPGSPTVCGAPAIEEHSNLTEDDFLPAFTYARNRATLSACIFLTLDRHCTLQIYSEQIGEHKWHFKPFYCWLFPLTAKRGIITIDERAYGLCLQPSPQAVHLCSLVKEELIYLIGEDGYADLIGLAESLEPDWQI